MSSMINYDRILPLGDLNAYPGSEYLDRTIQLLWTENPARRVWLLTLESAPTIHIEDAVLTPQKILAGPPRWIDYGTVELPFMKEQYPTWDGMVPIRFQGLSQAECPAAYLLITTHLEQSLEGCTIEDAQRRLWGLAQVDVGSTTLQPSRLTVGQEATFRVGFTAGPHGLPAGAYLRFIVPKAFSRPQTGAPNDAGYTFIRAADCRAIIAEVRDTLETHEKSSILCRLETPMPPNGKMLLQYHSARTFIYPADLNEVELRTWYSNLAPLTASAALSAEHPFVNMLPANGHTLLFTPGPSQRLHLFLPGRRFASERLALRGTFTDHYRNVPPSGSIDVDFELWLVSEGQEINLGTPIGNFVSRHRFVIQLPALSPGVYRVFARRPGKGAAVARSNPLEIIPEGSGERLYWGEIHSHTELGDGAGDFEEVYRHAREEGCLEFATVSEHAEYVSDNQWAWMQDVVNARNDPGFFVTLVGYETIGKQKDRNVYTSRPQLDLLRGSYHATCSLDKVWGHFHGDEQVVGGPHATMVHKTIWEHPDPTVERFIEVYSMWGASDFRDGPLVAPWIEAGRGLTVNEILQTGAHLGFTAGGDCHDGRVGFTSEDPDGQGITPHTFAHIILYRCGMTAANMPNLTRHSLVEALRNRRTYATTGDRMLLDFTVSNLPMGSIGPVSTAECRATVHGVSELQELQIVKDGQIVWTQTVGGLDVTVAWRDPNPPTGEHYYYLHVVQADGQRAWSSPVWVRPLDEHNQN
ncbi:MAG: hypothetical protein P8Z00_17740 [Anaerolineales bacterium]